MNSIKKILKLNKKNAETTTNREELLKIVEITPSYIEPAKRINKFLETA